MELVVESVAAAAASALGTDEDFAVDSLWVAAAAG